MNLVLPLEALLLCGAGGSVAGSAAGGWYNGSGGLATLGGLATPILNGDGIGGGEGVGWRVIWRP